MANNNYKTSVLFAKHDYYGIYDFTDIRYNALTNKRTLSMDVLKA